MTAVVLDRLTPLQRLAKELAALPHELVVRADVDTLCFQIHDRGEDVRGAVEQRTREHGAVDTLSVRILLAVEGFSGKVEALAGGVDTVFRVVKKAPGKAVDKVLLGD